MATGMLTVNALKIKLAERGASTRGRKEELIERLGRNIVKYYTKVVLFVF